MYGKKTLVTEIDIQNCFAKKGKSKWPLAIWKTNAMKSNYKCMTTCMLIELIEWKSVILPAQQTFPYSWICASVFFFIHRYLFELISSASKNRKLLPKTFTCCEIDNELCLFLSCRLFNNFNFSRFYQSCKKENQKISN